MVYVAVALALSTYLKHIDNTNTATERGKHVANIPTHCHCTATATALPLPHGTAQPPPLRDRDNHVLTNSHSHVTAWEPIT